MPHSLSLVWPLALVAGIGVGVFMSRKGKPRENALGFPFITVVLLAAMVWATEVYLTLGGFGHFDLYAIALFAFLVGFGASLLYVVTYLGTRAVADRIAKKRASRAVGCI